MRGKISLLLVGLVAAAAPAFGQSSGDSPLGLVAEAPAEGSFVKTDVGYMVPYQAEIPGTRVNYTMVPVPGGIHRMRRGGVSYFVEIEPFWMGKTEVTWAEYWEYMKLYLHFEKFKRRKLRVVNEKNEVDAVSAPTSLYDPKTIYDFGDQPNQPALGMRQYAAKQYTKWLSLQAQRCYRLPSEAEWEHACLAGSDGPYSFGDDQRKLDDNGWSTENSGWTTQPVGTKHPNAFGLYDMHGNVAEWVLDGMNSSNAVPMQDSTLSVAEAVSWPDGIFHRIAKGGSFYTEAAACTATSRLLSRRDWLSNDPESPPSPYWNSDGSYGCTVGFRLLRPLDVPDRESLEKAWDADVPELKKQLEMREIHGRNVRGLVDPGLPEAIRKLPPGW